MKTLILLVLLVALALAARVSIQVPIDYLRKLQRPHRERYNSALKDYNKAVAQIKRSQKLIAQLTQDIATAKKLLSLSNFKHNSASKHSSRLKNLILTMIKVSKKELADEHKNIDINRKLRDKASTTMKIEKPHVKRYQDLIDPLVKCRNSSKGQRKALADQARQARNLQTKLKGYKDLQRNLAAVNKQLNSQRGRLNRAVNRRNTCRNNLGSINRQISSMTNRLNNAKGVLRNTINSVNTCNSNLGNTRKALKNCINQKRASYARQRNSQGQLNSCNAQLNGCNANFNRARNNYNSCVARKRNADNELRNCNNQANHKQGVLNNVNNQRNQCIRDKNAYNNQYNQCQNQYRGMVNSRNAESNARQHALNQLNACRRSLANVQNKQFDQCITRSTYTNNAGVVRIGCPSGYTMVGGGMYNHYRGFNPRAAFEESMPEGNYWRCDMGFGPGIINCYVRCCKLKNAPCTITHRTTHHAGIVTVGCPGGYTMVSGGMYNIYRHWNRLSIFEESMPWGNGWRCDMGNGPGQLHCYARCCRFPTRKTCITRQTGVHVAGVIRIGCPNGYKMVGGGMYNHYRHWNALSQFEESMPESNHWRCDMGFGPGRVSCYVRCCTD
jgi:chromosome segregation ATPase